MASFFSLVAGLVIGLVAGWFIRGSRGTTAPAAAPERPAAAPPRQPAAAGEAVTTAGLTAASPEAANTALLTLDAEPAAETTAVISTEPAGADPSATQVIPDTGTVSAADSDQSAATQVIPDAETVAAADSDQSAATQTIPAATEEWTAPSTADIEPAGPELTPAPFEPASTTEPAGTPEPDTATAEQEPLPTEPEPLPTEHELIADPEPITTADPIAAHEPITTTEPAAAHEPITTTEHEPVDAAEPIRPTGPVDATATVPAGAESGYGDDAPEPTITLDSPPEPLTAAGWEPADSEPGATSVDSEPAATTIPEPLATGTDEIASGAVTEPDDLTRIAGIGPKTAMALAAAGITTYRRLADSDVADLRAAITGAGMRVAPSVATWPERAKALADNAA